MTKKIGNKSIGGVKSLTRTKNIEDTKGVSRVAQVQGAAGVGKLGGVQGIGRRNPTRTMTLAEREELFKMIDEEAEKMFGASGLTPDRRAVVRDAVKMAVDSALLDSSALESSSDQDQSKTRKE